MDNIQKGKIREIFKVVMPTFDMYKEYIMVYTYVYINREGKKGWIIFRGAR